MPAPEFRIRLEWRAEGIERWRLGSLALSVGLPIGAATGPRDMRGLDFFENLLPEGPAAARMAALAGVRPVDTLGIPRRHLRRHRRRRAPHPGEGPAERQGGPGRARRLRARHGHRRLPAPSSHQGARHRARPHLPPPPVRPARLARRP
ncbi:MAG: HipA N-terminal domain-containing protein [Streptosporangiaceae bacterium]